MDDDGLDRMWGDAPSTESTDRKAGRGDEDEAAGEEGDATGRRRRTSTTGSPGDRERVPGDSAGQQERKNRSGSTDSGKEDSTPEPVGAGDVQEAGPPNKEEIETRKRQFVIRADQDRALNRALAGEDCSYGDDRSEVIQALLDLHGFCD
jgi:hypothetical protein